jgi:hypothetical protein
MTQREAAESILRLERRLEEALPGGAAGLVFHGDRHGNRRKLRVWPLVRQRLWGLLVNPALHQRALPAEFRRDVAFELTDACRAALERAAAQGPVDVLAMTRDQDGTVAGGRLWDRVADPLLLALPEGATGLKIGRDGSGGVDGAAGGGDVAERLPALPLETVMRVRGPFPEEGVAGFAELRRLSSEVCGLEPDEDLVLKDALVALAWAGLWAEALQLLRPGAVLTACYNHPPMNGLMLACREAGAASADVQHGKQGAFQAAYTHWSTFPESGWELLPDWFWTWGAATREDVSRWAGGSAHAPKPIIGGYPWIGLWAGGQLDGASECRRARELAGEGVCVLVTLQPVWEGIPPEVMEAMAAAPGQWRWLLRAHPRQRGGLERIEAQAASIPGLDFEVRESTRLPLYALFRAASVHVTAYSSCCLEALHFGLPTVLWGERAAAIFSGPIGSGTFLHAAGGGELPGRMAEALRLRAAATGPLTWPEAGQYIETTADAARKAARTILAAGRRGRDQEVEHG